MATLQQAKQQVSNFANNGVSERDIDAYIKSTGFSIDEIASEPLQERQPQQIQAEIQKQETVPQVIDSRQQNITNLAEQRRQEGSFVPGQVGFENFEGALQGGADVISEVGQGAADIIGLGLRKILPEGAPEYMRDIAGKSIKTLAGTLPGQVMESLIGSGFKSASEVAKEYPRSAKALKNIAIIASAATPAGVVKPDKETFLGQTAKGITSSASNQRQNFLLKLTRELPSNASELKNVKRTEVKGLLNTSVVTPSAREISVAKELEKVKGLSPFKGSQANFNELAVVKTKVAKQVEKELGKANVKIPDALNNIKQKVFDAVTTHPNLVKQEELGRRMIEQANRIMNKHPKNTLGLHKARIEFDNYVKGLKAKTDPKAKNILSVDAAEEPRSLIAKTIRKSMNDTIDSKHGTQIKDLRKRQELMFEASDVLQEKAAKDGKNLITRAIAGVAKAVPERLALVQGVALGFGLSNLSATTKFAPIFSAVAVPTVAGHGISKLAVTPTSKRAIAKLISAVDIAIKKTKTKEAIKLLRADRAALLSLAQGTLGNAEETK